MAEFQKPSWENAMPTRTPDGLITLSSDELRQFAVEALLHHVHLHINGTKCTLETVYDLILKASAGQTSISDVCDDTPGAPSGTATLNHLHAALPHDLGHLWHLEAKLNRVLVANLKPRQLRVRCDVAIDLVLVPYHGEPAQDPEEVRRSEAREGTTHFHCYATAYMIYKDQRITLALTFVRKSDTMPTILRRLFKRLDVLDLQVKKLYLDKGFYSISVIRLLKARGTPFILPVVTRRSGGVGKLFVGRASYRTNYTLRNQELGTETIDVALVRKYSKGHYRRRGSKWFAYVTYQVRTHPLQIFQFYRRRFGIESSYRQMNRVRARTASTNPALRLLLVGLAFLLINLWVHFKQLYACDRHRAGRRLNPRRLTLLRMMHLLIRAIETDLKPLTQLQVPIHEVAPTLVSGSAG
jgi:putative transposase